MLVVLFIAPLVYWICLKWHNDRYFDDSNINDLSPRSVVGYRVRYLTISLWVGAVSYLIGRMIYDKFF